MAGTAESPWKTVLEWHLEAGQVTLGHLKKHWTPAYEQLISEMFDAI